MSDLISRADAIEAIASRDETDGTVKVFTGREVNEILSELPSADAVATFRTGQTYGKSISIRELTEVVRCKDCKHRHEAECPMFFEEEVYIDEGDGYYDTDYIIHDYTQDDGYCYYGLREDGNTE